MEAKTSVINEKEANRKLDEENIALVEKDSLFLDLKEVLLYIVFSNFCSMYSKKKRNHPIHISLLKQHKVCQGLAYCVASDEQHPFIFHRSTF